MEAKKPLGKRIKDYGWYFVSRLKSNRTVNGVKVQKLLKRPYQSIIGYLKGGLKVIVAKYKQHYYVSNRLSLNLIDIKRWYEKRWIIEEVNKLLKFFHIKCCQSVLIGCWINHIYLIFFSFCFVEILRQKFNITVYKAKVSLKIRSYKYLFKRLERIMDDV